MENLTQFQKRILEIIKGHSIINPITAKDILDKIGSTNFSGEIVAGAQIREVINALRDKGYPVCASGAGYYEPQTQKELEEYIKKFQARINEQQKAVDNLNKSLIKWRQVSHRT